MLSHALTPEQLLTEVEIGTGVRTAGSDARWANMPEVKVVPVDVPTACCCGATGQAQCFAGAAMHRACPRPWIAWLSEPYQQVAQAHAGQGLWYPQCHAVARRTKRGVPVVGDSI